MAISTLGGVGMWSVVMVLPAVQAEYGVDRASASLAYTATMIGFAGGGLAMGRLSDRIGVVWPVLIGTVMLAAGYGLAGSSAALWEFVLAQAVLIGLGSSATYAPLVADASLWFRRYRGIAVALCASGSYISGAVWPPVIQHFVVIAGWRTAYIGAGLFCLITILPLAAFLRLRPPLQDSEARTVKHSPASMGLSPRTLQALLSLAGVAGCLAMSTPQVHIVAYCSDQGYGAARGAEMLSFSCWASGSSAGLGSASSLTGSAASLFCWSAPRCRSCPCCSTSSSTA